VSAIGTRRVRPHGLLTTAAQVKSKANTEQAIYTRDAFAKGTYDRAFSWLIQRINKNIVYTTGASCTSVCLSLVWVCLFVHAEVSVCAHVGYMLMRAGAMVAVCV
jgi:hypothetical protein